MPILLALAVTVGVGVVALAIGSHAHRVGRQTEGVGSNTSTAIASTHGGAPPDAQDDLTGIWSGHQSGAYNGTLTISWRESGWMATGPGIYHANLAGSITLPAPAGTESVRGTWDRACGTNPCHHGDAIKFRTVSGGAPVLYTGSYSSGHMSGSYRTATGHGSWSATLQH